MRTSQAMLQKKDSNKACLDIQKNLFPKVRDLMCPYLVRIIFHNTKIGKIATTYLLHYLFDLKILNKWERPKRFSIFFSKFQKNLNCPHNVPTIMSAIW